jgi:trehalose-phosphatase
MPLIDPRSPRAVVAELGAPRRLPPLLAHLDALAQRRAGRPVAVFLDFDGTLSPIVDDPGAAEISADMGAAIAAVAERHTVAIVSGRDRPDVQARIGLDHLFYAGSHGLDIAGPGRAHVLPEAEALLDDLARAEAILHARLDFLPGALVEHKRLSVAAHYRGVAPSDLETVVRAVEEALEDCPRLRVHQGKKVFDLQPDVAWDKGRAVEWLMDVLDVDFDRHLVLYIGDDLTDEDAFRVIADAGVCVRVGPEVASTLAEYRLSGPAEVQQLLLWLAR